MENEECKCISNIMNQGKNVWNISIFNCVNIQIEGKYIKYFLQKKEIIIYIYISYYSLVIKNCD